MNSCFVVIVIPLILTCQHLYMYIYRNNGVSTLRNLQRSATITKCGSMLLISIITHTFDFDFDIVKLCSSLIETLRLTCFEKCGGKVSGKPSCTQIASQRYLSVPITTDLFTSKREIFNENFCFLQWMSSPPNVGLQNSRCNFVTVNFNVAADNLNLFVKEFRRLSFLFIFKSTLMFLVLKTEPLNNK